MRKLQEEKMSDSVENVPKGIGGWLILVVIGLIVAPIRIGHFLATTYWPILIDGTWERVTTPGTEAYHHLWAPLLIFEAIVNVGSIALAGVTLVFLFKHSRHTPKLAIAWLSWGAVSVTYDFFLGDLIPAIASQSDTSNAKDLGRTLVNAAIWIPYFLISKRVKATFVK